MDQNAGNFPMTQHSSTICFDIDGHQTFLYHFNHIFSPLSRDLIDEGALNIISDVLQSQDKELFSAG